MKRRKRQAKRGLSFFLALALGVGLGDTVNSNAIPPPAVPPDGHDAAAVLATGSVIPISTQAQADLFKTILAFHVSLNDAQNIMAETCLNCHSDIAQKEFIQRKMPSEDGSIVVSKEINHHLQHSKKAFLAFEEACTFCHKEFAVAQKTDQVIISSYVEKTTCAGCHSRFSPRGYMDVSYYEENGCPGCHEGAWEPAHIASPTYAPYIRIEKIDLSQNGCLKCHGENKMKMPEFLQDLFWSGR